MEGDEITKLEGIEVPAGFAGDEIGHKIPEDAPSQRAARAPALLSAASLLALHVASRPRAARAGAALRLALHVASRPRRNLSARVQHFEFNSSTFYCSNFTNLSVQFQHFYYQMLNWFSKILN